MSKIIIADYKTDEVLDHIVQHNVIENWHEQDMSTWKETFEFETFANEDYAKHLTDRNILLIPDEDGGFRELFIVNARRFSTTTGTKLIDVTAFGFYQKLATAKIIDAGSTPSQAAEPHMRSILAGTNVNVGNVAYTGNRTITRENKTDAFAALKSLANEFGLELNFRIEIVNGKVIRYADLLDRIGEWRGRTVEFGRDLQTISRKSDSSNIVTALLVLGPRDEEGNRIEEFVEDEDARKRWSTDGSHIVATYEPQTENQDITRERLHTLGRTELNKRINALVSWEINITDLEHVPGMSGMKIRYGDTIFVKDTGFNPPFYVEARIFKRRRNIFNPGSKQVTLGDFREFTIQEVRSEWEQLREDLEKKIDWLNLRARILPIEGSLRIIEKDKLTVDQRYAEISMHPNLPLTIFNSLADAKATYDLSYSTLHSYLSDENGDFDFLYEVYSGDLAQINHIFDLALDEIALDRDDRIQDELDRAQQEIDDAKDRLDESQIRLDEADSRIDDAMGYIDDMSVLVDEAVQDANDAVGRVDDITDIANDALSEAQKAFDDAQAALNTAGNAESIANTVQDLANALDTTVSGHSTQLIEMEDEISRKMTTIDADAKYATQSALTQTSENLSSEIVAVQGNLDDLEIGSVNLIANSSFLNDLYSWSNPENLYAQIATTASLTLFEYVLTLDTTTNNQYVRQENIKVVPNEHYTISWWMRDSGNGNDNTVLIRGIDIDTGSETWVNPGFSRDNSWRKYSHTFSLNADMISIRLGSAGSSSVFGRTWFTGLQLEKGNKVTDHSLSPKDIEYEFSSINQTVGTISTQVGDNSGNISTMMQTIDSFATRIEDNEGNISSFTQTVEGFQTRVSDVEGNVSSVTQLADALQTRMTDAEGNINELTITAQSFDSRITDMGDDLAGFGFDRRNLIQNGAFLTDDLTGWVIRNVPTIRVSESTSHTIFKLVLDITTDDNNQRIEQSGIEIDANEDYTISWWANNGTGTENTVLISYIDLSTGSTSWVNPRIYGSGGWRRHSRTFNINAEEITVHIGSSGSSSSFGRSYFTGIQLEKGTEVSAWQPSIKDYASQSQISQLADNINLRVEKDDIINQINISDESILISGNRLLIDSDTHVEGTISAPDAVFKDLAVENADLRNVNITGTLDSVGGTFTGDLTAAGGTFTGRLTGVDGTFTGTVTAGRIESGTTINVSTDLKVGNNITLGNYTTGTSTKSIDFFRSGSVPQGAITASASSGIFTLDLHARNAVRVQSPSFGTSGDMSVDGDLDVRMDIDAMGTITAGGAIFFGSGAALDATGYSTALRSTNQTQNFIRILNSSGRVDFYMGGSITHTFNTNGTISATSFNTGSLEELKQGIELMTESALDVIRESDIHKYHLKADIREGIDKPRYGLVIGEGRNTPHQILDDEMTSVSQYDMVSFAWKGIQELDRTMTEEINWLKTENQYLRNEIKKLKEKVA